MLIVIGGIWSEDVAVWGFHTQAGWITFILTSLAVMWLAHNSRAFAKQVTAVESPGSTMNLPIATLVPLIALLAMTFVTQALSGEFDWLYPLRVLVTAGCILYCIKYLDLFPLKLTYIAPLAGFIVAVLWVLMVSPHPEVDANFTRIFAETNSTLVGLWLLFRFLGTVLTVPIAEELGFRAYLLCRFASAEVVTRGPVPFSLLAVGASSIAFGMLHGAWLAGTLAGLVYALVRYRSQHVLDAIVAHGITNMLLFGYAMGTGQWSLL